MNISIKVINTKFGGFESFAFVNNEEDLNALRKRYRKTYSKDLATTITFSCFENGNEYFEQIQ